MSQNQLEQIKTRALSAFEKAQSINELYQAKVQFLGKTGELTEVMKLMATLPKEEKPLFGKKVNEVKELLEKLYTHLEGGLELKEVQTRMRTEKLDLTLPGQGQTFGHLHPIQTVTDEIFQILSRLGYSLRTGPLIEKDYYNFEALNLPQNHPARDMQDTFFVDQSHVLRTHTSPIQVHSLETEKLPLRIMGTGAVFRCDSDI
ncbi:MAG: phenylalanine--tRNA ligase subunit alpha, partial [Bdellovibrionales bacterium]